MNTPFPWKSTLEIFRCFSLNPAHDIPQEEILDITNPATYDFFGGGTKPHLEGVFFDESQATKAAFRGWR